MRLAGWLEKTPATPQPPAAKGNITLRGPAAPSQSANFAGLSRDATNQHANAHAVPALQPASTSVG